MFRKFIFQVASVCLVVLFCAIPARSHGALITTISGSPLANNSTGQTLSVSIRSDSGVISDVEAFNIYAEIGTGLAGQVGVPVFTGFAWSPAISAQLGTPVPTVVAPETNDFRALASLTDFQFPDVALNSATIGTSDTLIGTFTIDTTGISDDTFDFSILDGLGTTSDINSISQGTIPFAFNGTFDVGAGAAAVPEPSSLLALGVLGGGIAWRRRRRAATVNSVLA